MEGFLFQAKDYPIELCYRPPHGFVQVREALPSGASKTPLWPGTNPVLNIRTSNAVRTERLNGDFGPRSMSRLHSMVGNIAWQRWIGRGHFCDFCISLPDRDDDGTHGFRRFDAASEAFLRWLDLGCVASDSISTDGTERKPLT